MIYVYIIDIEIVSPRATWAIDLALCVTAVATHSTSILNIGCPIAVSIKIGGGAEYIAGDINGLVLFVPRYIIQWNY